MACKTQNILQTMIKISIIGFEIAIRLCIQRHTHTVLVENRSEKMHMNQTYFIRALNMVCLTWICGERGDAYEALINNYAHIF